ncbi:MAG: hypothetical protein LJE68_14930 [Rhodobacter sp.]|nr:hypothetical protein [Rhodobacter sp.]
MPLGKLALIVASAMIAAGLTVWVGAWVTSALQFDGSVWPVAIPAALVCFAVWRVIAWSMRNEP